MFSSFFVLDKYKSYKPRIINAICSINMGDMAKGNEALTELLNDIKKIKDGTIVKSEQIQNELFVFCAYIKFLISYATIWEKLVDQKYGNSWTSLQNTIDQFRIVKKFSCKNKDSKHLSFFENQLISLEKLYPYNIFFSIGAVVDYFECSICGLDIDSDKCPHFKGELYNGEIAVAIAKNIRELDHVSMVKNPADKRCIVQYDDEGEQFKMVRYISKLLREKMLRPFDFGKLRFSEKIIPNPDYVKLGRNQKCFCGSGKKFKHCCIDEKTVNGGHIDIISTPTSVHEVLA